MMGVILLMAVGAAAADGADVDAFFAEFVKKRDNVITLQARFVQESVVPEETRQTPGTIVYVRPKRIVFRYEAPDPTYLVDDLRVFEYLPDAKQLRILTLEDTPQTEALFLGFDEDTQRLREGYDVALIDTAGEPAGARALHLRPKKGAEEDAPFKECTLYLRAEDYLPYRIEEIGDEDSRITIRITDYAINQAIESGAAQIDLAEGTSVVEADRIVETIGPGGKRVPEAPKIPSLAPRPTETPAP